MSYAAGEWFRTSEMRPIRCGYCLIAYKTEKTITDKKDNNFDYEVAKWIPGVDRWNTWDGRIYFPHDVLFWAEIQHVPDDH